MRRYIIALLVFVLSSIANAADTTNTPYSEHSGEYVAVEFDAPQDPLHFGSMEALDKRQRVEHVHLIKRLDRQAGKWNANHPRYRLLEAMYSYVSYKDRNMAELDRWKNLYKNLSRKQKATLERAVDYKGKLDEIEECIYENAMLCKSMVVYALEYYGIERKELDGHIAEAKKNNRQADKTSVSQALKHFVRDWSDEGTKEREDAFPCILGILNKLKKDGKGRESLKVLLPGAGLGRLGHEVIDMGGFKVTINEWSTYMNIAYRYLSAQRKRNSTKFYPFVDSLSHHITTSDLLREVTFPDTLPHASILLVEGDFTTGFLQTAHYDVIVTHFFIDTARNLISYFETIHRLLKKGGYWINFGPLLYGTGPFVQLSLDEIVAVVEEMGFVFQDVDARCGNVSLERKRIRGKEAEYGFNERALVRNVYLAQVWVVRKT